LSIGGESAGIAVPGVPSGTIYAWIGVDEHGLFIEPVETPPEGERLLLDGRPLSEHTVLEDGDRLALGDARMRANLDGQGAELLIEHLAGNVTAAPLLTDEQRQGALADAAPLAIRGTTFTPFASGGTRKSRGRSPARYALAAGLAVLALSVWFFTTATAVRVIAEPREAKIDFGGAWPEISYGENHLVRPGAYTLIASSRGYETARVPVKVNGDPHQNVTVTLHKQPGVVTIEAPRGVVGTITVDGRPVGPVPGTYTIAAGARAVVVRAPRYQDLSETLQVEGGGERQTYKPALVPVFSAVTVESVPAGARVAVDGREVGVTPMTTNIDAGSYTLTLNAEGYRPWESSIQVVANTPQRIGPVQLGLPDGHVTVKSTPAQADVAVGGRYRGKTPLDLALAPGVRHEIVVTRAGFEAARRVVPVAASERIGLEVTLKPVLGQVTVRGEPADAILYVSGQARGPANQTLTLPATDTPIEVRRDGYETFATTVTPQPGFARLVEYKLQTPQEAQVAKFAPVITTGSTKTRLRLLPPGTYQMGSPRREPGRRANETERKVTLKRPFYFGEREVTNAEFRLFRPEHLSGVVRDRSLDQDNHPVVNVSWRDAAEFCNWLSGKEGLPAAYATQGDALVAVSPLNTGYRLPTEAEWEWAARYQKGAATRRYPWGPSLPITPRSGNYGDKTALELLEASLANYDDGYETTAPVATFPPNELGIYDLGGNVAEWINDFYTVYLDLSAGPAVDPVGPASGQNRVLRGSSWRTLNITELRLAYRSNFDGKADYVGFRIARYAE
jgi:formylglycine-generating enzyme required for sulfatase activity